MLTLSAYSSSAAVYWLTTGSTSVLSILHLFCLPMQIASCFFFNFYYEQMQYLRNRNCPFSCIQDIKGMIYKRHLILTFFFCSTPFYFLKDLMSKDVLSFCILVSLWLSFLIMVLLTINSQEPGFHSLFTSLPTPLPHFFIFPSY